MKKFTIHGLFFLYFFKIVCIKCTCPRHEFPYPKDYSKFHSHDSRRFAPKEYEIDPPGLDFELDHTEEAQQDFYEENETTFNLSEILLDDQLNVTVATTFDSYQNEFNQRYSQGSNYNEIFQNVTKSSPDDYLQTFHDGNYSFSSFPKLYEIYEYLRVLEKLGEGRATVIPLKEYNGTWNIVHTHLDNEILSIRISSKPLESNEQNPIIVVVAGIHGRDWYAVQSAIFLAKELILNENRSTSLDFDWWIVPILNPDGYEITHTESKWRNWEKNLHGIGEIENDSECFGIDLDLNFEYQWLSCDESFCDSNYPGTDPFTEPETRGLRDTLEAFSDYCDSFIALKEGSQSLVFPFSDTREIPRYSNRLTKISQDALAAFGKHVEGPYRYGQSSYLMDMEAGYIEDWAKVHLGIFKSFAFYLGPREKDRRELKSQHLMDHMNGTFDLLDVIARSRIHLNTRNSSFKIVSSLLFLVINFILQYFY